MFLVGNEEGRVSRKPNSTIAAALVLGAVIVASNANADFFEGLGFLPGYDYSEAVGVSADGKSVAGNIRPIGGESNGTSQAFFWTSTTGMVGLGSPTGGNLSRAFAISGDGSTVVGTGLNSTGAGNSSFVWNARTGFGPIPGAPPNAFGINVPLAVNANGSIVGGGVPNTGAVLWSAAAGQVKLTPSGETTGVSANGFVAVGAVAVGSHEEAFRWTASTGAVRLGLLPGALDSGATAVSANGSTVVGSVQRYGDIGDEAFRWTASTGMKGLGWLPGDNFSEALAVNAKGSVIVGVSGVSGSNDFQAFLWTKQTGMISIQSLLEREG
jgi:probable HAF family extracellular repeat protein